MGIREPHEVKKKSFDLGGFDSHRSQKIYTSELILCFTVVFLVHNIHMYP